MPRRLLKKFLPDRHSVSRQWFMRPFGALIKDPVCWTVHRRSVARAVALGLFICFIPLPIHLILTPFAALLLRANLPVALITILPVNLFTLVPVFFTAYWIGAHLTGAPLAPFHFALTWHWAETQLTHVWKPLLLGCLVMAVAAAMLGYAATSLIWRLHVIYRYRHRAASLRVRASAIDQNPSLKY
jgi:uncharacterized protein (DUF2062 family)